MQDTQNLLPDATKTIAILQNIWEKREYKTEIERLSIVSQTETFWQNPDHVAVLERLSFLNNTQAQLASLSRKINEFAELMALFAEQEDELAEINRQITLATKELQKLKISLLLTGPYDQNNCFLSVNPGAGGTESQDWAEMLLRMYIRFCEKNNYLYKMIDLQRAEQAGIKGATIQIIMPMAYGTLKSECGVHRLVRISPFDANKRRHTSFASVYLAPEIPENKIHIAPEDLRIDTFRASGAGGQHVNTTDSAIRITHIPSGIVVQCQNERSQGQNKHQAMKMLAAKLAEQEEQKRLQQQNINAKQKIEWGSQIRSYVLHPYKMVKDHRTDWQSHQPEAVLDGDLQDFIEAFLQEG